MEEQIEIIIKNGEKERKGGLISLIIFGIITLFIGVISVFEHGIISLMIILIISDLCFIGMIVDGKNRINNPHKYFVATQNNTTSNILNFRSSKNEKNIFKAYKSKWIWEDAAKEYLKKNNINSIEELTEEDNDKIYEYASMPAVYFFVWLVENKYMSSYFYADYDSSFINKIINRQSSPVEYFTIGLDCALTRDDISEQILPFVDNYFEVESKRNYINFSYLDKSDYYDCIKNEQGFIFCIDFSWSIYDRISKKINNAYSEYKDSIKNNK